MAPVVRFGATQHLVVEHVLHFRTALAAGGRAGKTISGGCLQAVPCPVGWTDSRHMATQIKTPKKGMGHAGGSWDAPRWGDISEKRTF